MLLCLFLGLTMNGLRALDVDFQLYQEVTVTKGDFPLERTRWYFDLPDRVATLYKLKYSERTL